jgi:hypothetical protein
MNRWKQVLSKSMAETTLREMKNMVYHGLSLLTQTQKLEIFTSDTGIQVMNSRVKAFSDAGKIHIEPKTINELNCVGLFVGDIIKQNCSK